MRGRCGSTRCIPAEKFIKADELADREEPDLVATLAPLLRARTDLKSEDVMHLEQLISSAVRRFQSERSTREG